MALKSKYKFIVVTGIWAMIIYSLSRALPQWPNLEDWSMLINEDTIKAGMIFIACFVFASMLRSFRWGVMLKERVDFSWSEIIPVFNWVFFLSNITPLRAGEAGRLVWIRNKGCSASWGAGLLVSERLTDIFVLTVLFSLAGMFSPDSAEVFVIINGVYFVLFITLYVFICAFSRNIKNYITSHLNCVNECDESEQTIMQKSAGAISRILDGVGYISNFKSNAFLLLVTMAIWLMLAAGFHLYYSSFFHNIHWTATLAVLVAVNLSSFLSVTPGNFGLYEAVSVFVLGMFNIPLADAFISSLGLHAIVFALILIMAVISKVVMTMQGGKVYDVV